MSTTEFRRYIYPATVFLAAWLSVSVSFAVTPAKETRQVASASGSLAPGAYFGLKLPGDTPEIFAPGIINIPGRNVDRVAFSPDGTECYFSVFDGVWTNNRILFIRYENGAWTPPALASFADGRQEGEPLFSRDGNRLYFTAQNTSGGRTDTDIFMVQRASKEDEWSKPEPLSAPLNSPKDEWHLSLTADGTMYFASNRDGGHDGLDIYRTVSKPGQPLQVENLGLPVNSSNFNNGGPGISPDGHTLVFPSNRPGVTNGSMDFFICFDNGHGGWTTPVNMGGEFNNLGHYGRASFSQDGRILFFVRFDGKHGNVYWVSTMALERFRGLSH
jgi:hypothetical protein